MLNISENSINKYIRLSDFKSTSALRKTRIRRLPLILTLSFILFTIACMFLPWTQNIQAKGYVTTRSPQQRPQAIQSVLSGRLEKWYVQEGDYVEAGDTLIFISDIKSDYFDPDLVQRTQEQVDAKSSSVSAYDAKIEALSQQYKALENAQQLKTEQIKNKIQQARNKVQIDSLDLVAFTTNWEIAKNQLSRTQQLFDKGLKSLSELQEKQLKEQQTATKRTVQQNKLLNRRNELINYQIELDAVAQEYADKLAKSQSDRQSALTSKLESIANVAKLQNQLSNYNERQRLYQITAPQSGYITKTIKKGIGEIIKEGTDIAIIVPKQYDLAVEIYVKPQDLPLLNLGNDARLRFDGWPAVVISGWPESSTGIFDGNIVALDQNISDNGYYRVLISPDTTVKTWPRKLRVGTGVNTFILLKEVSIWYEIWRQLNGFPVDYYKDDKLDSGKDVKRKAPLKSVK